MQNQVPRHADERTTFLAGSLNRYPNSSGPREGSVTQASTCRHVVCHQVNPSMTQRQKREGNRRKLATLKYCKLPTGVRDSDAGELTHHTLSQSWPRDIVRKYESSKRFLLNLPLPVQRATKRLRGRLARDTAKLCWAAYHTLLKASRCARLKVRKFFREN